MGLADNINCVLLPGTVVTGTQRQILPSKKKREENKNKARGIGRTMVGRSMQQ